MLATSACCCANLVSPLVPSQSALAGIRLPNRPPAAVHSRAFAMSTGQPVSTIDAVLLLGEELLAEGRDIALIEL